MASHELKLSPQQIKEWCLSDLVELSADIISKNDMETYYMYCNQPKKGK